MWTSSKRHRKSVVWGFVAVALLAPAALAQMTAADLTGTWQVDGVDGRGAPYRGTIAFSPAGLLLLAAGALEVNGASAPFTGYAFVDPDVLHMIVSLESLGAVRQHEVRFDPSTGAYRSSWRQIGGGATGTETYSRRSDLEVDVGGSPRTIELARRIATGRFTRDEALEFLDRNFDDSQDYIHRNIRRTIHPNYSSGHVGPMVGLVEHYTTNPEMDPTLRYFTANQSRKASSHFVIDADGRVMQVVRHTHRSWHAGAAANHTHFGIENANAGSLTRKGSRFYDYYDREYRRSLPLFGTRPLDFGRKVWGHRYWMPWPHAQIESNLVVARALAAVYPLRRDQILTHKEVSPGRRSDPGPAFPMRLFADEVFSGRALGTVPWLEEYRTDPDFMVRYQQP